jgi:hypothetical protein
VAREDYWCGLHREQGNFALQFNSEGMYRGVKASDGFEQVGHLQIIFTSCDGSIKPSHYFGNFLNIL